LAEEEIQKSGNSEKSKFITDIVSDEQVVLASENSSKL